jgi:hypothetical protein
MQYLVRLKSTKTSPEGIITPANKGYMIPVRSFKEASETVEQFIADNQVYFEYWAGGGITDTDGNHIGNVAFNGRVFDTRGQEISVD